MAQTIIARSHEAHITLLEQKMQRQYYEKMFWARFAGFSTEDDRGMDMPPSNPLNIKRGLATAGGDNLKMVMLRNLTEEAIYGDVDAAVQAETQVTFFLDVYLNQRRKPVGPPAKMGNQRVKRLNLPEMARPQIEDFFAADTEIEIASAFYTKHSRNVSATALKGGYALTDVPHPNIYTADAGKVTYNATIATYETSIAAAVANLTGAASDLMSLDVLESLRTEMLKQKIRKFQGFWILLISYSQAQQLRKDSDWKQAQREANVRSSENPLWTGALASAAGFMIFERDLGVFGLDSTGGAGNFIWGATNPHEGVDEFDHKCAIAFGERAMCQAWAEGPFFEEQDYDAKNRQVVVGGIIDGFGRPDYEDATTTPTDTDNQSSVILVSFSPTQWT